MHTAEQKLKERIKELTCLYEVTSLIVNSDYEQIEEVLRAIASCLQKACQYNEETFVELKTPLTTIRTKKKYDKYVFLKSPVSRILRVRPKNQSCTLPVRAGALHRLFHRT